MGAGVKITPIQTGGVTMTKREWTQFALGNNIYDSINAGFTASDDDGGDPAVPIDSVLPAYLAMGKISATGKLVPLTPAATNGSQFLYGFLDIQLQDSLTVAATTTTAPLTCVVGGRVQENKIAFPAGVTLDTVITSDGRTYRTATLGRFEFVKTEALVVSAE
jgi:hypothetical protein